MVCRKCKSKAVSTTNDGSLGTRNHCLKCGYVWKKQSKKVVTQKTEKESK